MNERLGDERMVIEVNDFGPIVNARVDLRPLTVFVGPNDTGKSYLAALIYALHRFVGRVYGLARGSDLRLSTFAPGWGDLELSEGFSDAYLALLQSLPADASRSNGKGLAIPPFLVEALQAGLDSQAKELAAEVRRCFGVADAGALTRKSRTSAMRIRLRRASGDANVAMQTAELAPEPRLRTTVPAGATIPRDFDPDDAFHRFLEDALHSKDFVENDRVMDEAFVRETLSSLGATLLPSMFGPLCRPAFFLPADRTGVMRALDAEVRALVANAPGVGLECVDCAPASSGVTADFRAQLIAVDDFLRAGGDSDEDLGKRIETNVLGGSVRAVGTRTSCPRFAFRPRGWRRDLPLANASSMVSELAPLVLFLRYAIEPGDLLIVEEPESHLHPETQVALTRQLAGLVEEGVRVLVTTHSEWLLEELAIVVRRSKVPESRRRGEAALPPERAGVWLFDPSRKPKGSVVREIPLDQTGTFPSGYDDVAIALHHEWAGLTDNVREAG